MAGATLWPGRLEGVADGIEKAHDLYLRFGFIEGLFRWFSVGGAGSCGIALNRWEGAAWGWPLKAGAFSILSIGMPLQRRPRHGR